MKNAKLTSLLFGATLALSLAGGGCMLQVEADVPEVEVTQHGLAFPGVPTVVSGGQKVALNKSFSQKHQRLDLPAGLTTEVKALGITLTAQTGIDNFDFLHNLIVTMSDGEHDPVTLIEYERVDGAPSTSVLTMEAKNPVNTLDQWKTDSATFTIQVAGEMPPADWTMDVSMRFSGKLKYKY
jgi:hypothetical protein